SALSRTLARVRTRAGCLPDDTICSSRRRWPGVSRTTYLSLRATAFLLSGADEEDTKRQISCNELGRRPCPLPTAPRLGTAAPPRRRGDRVVEHAPAEAEDPAHQPGGAGG